MSVPWGPATSCYRFGTLELDVAQRHLRRDGALVAIAPKPLELLILLLENHQRMVSRREALASVWPDVRVSAATLSSTLRDLRRAIGDDARTPCFVQTARGMGFRFLAPVEIRKALEPASADADEAVLVGRGQLLQRLETAWAAAAAGKGRVVVLEGEPGIGKTRLMDAVAASARAGGAIVCHARFLESAASLAYRPWAQLLGTLVETLPAEQLQEAMGPSLPWLARLVPALDTGSEPPSDLDDEGATFRLLDAVTGFLRRVARRTPLVLVLDDLHAADRSSLHLLEHLAEEIRDERVLILGSYRACELDPEHPLPATIAELARSPSYQRHRVEGVDLESTRVLIRTAMECEPAVEDVAEIQARTDGNPFYVRELALFFAERVPGAHAAPVPPSLIEVLRGCLQRMPLRTRNTLELASAIGRSFDLELLRRASGLEIDDLMEALAQGQRLGLVEQGWGDVRCFRHVLVQEAIYAGLPGARQRLLHRRVGEAARALAMPDRPERLALAAYQLCRVAEEVGTDAFEVAMAAARQADATLAFEDAQRLYEMALDALDRVDGEDAVRRCPLLLALANGQLRAGEVGKAVVSARHAAALARTIARPDLMAEAALLFADYVLADGSELCKLLNEALASLGPEHEALRGRSLAALANALWYEGQRERRIGLAEQAIAIARAAESPTDLVAALLAKRNALMAPQFLDERLRLDEQALREADRWPNRAQHCMVLAWRACDLMESGDRAAAERDVARLEEIARATSLRRFLDHPPRWRALLAKCAGRLDEAEAWIAEAGRWRQRADFQNAESYGLIQLALLMRERGKQAELVAVVQQAPWLDPYRARVPAARASVALIELEGGHPGSARRVLADFVADDCAVLRDDTESLATVSWLAEICARLGAREEAAVLYERFAPYRDRFAGLFAIMGRGSMARYLGLLAATAGRREEAAECFQAALAANRANGFTLYEAWTQWEYARLLSSQGERESAEALAVEARATAERLGLEKLRVEIERGVPPVVPPGGR